MSLSYPRGLSIKGVWAPSSRGTGSLRHSQFSFNKPRLPVSSHDTVPMDLLPHQRSASGASFQYRYHDRVRIGIAFSRLGPEVGAARKKYLAFFAGLGAHGTRLPIF